MYDTFPTCPLIPHVLYIGGSEKAGGWLGLSERLKISQIGGARGVESGESDDSFDMAEFNETKMKAEERERTKRKVTRVDFMKLYCESQKRLMEYDIAKKKTAPNRGSFALTSHWRLVRSRKSTHVPCSQGIVATRMIFRNRGIYSRAGSHQVPRCAVCGSRSTGDLGLDSSVSVVDSVMWTRLM